MLRMARQVVKIKFVLGLPVESMMVPNCFRKQRKMLTSINKRKYGTAPRYLGPASIKTSTCGKIMTNKTAGKIMASVAPTDFS